jgi:hypothetical protein
MEANLKYFEEEKKFVTFSLNQARPPVFYKVKLLVEDIKLFFIKSFTL